jgi:hypothetical protein
MEFVLTSCLHAVIGTVRLQDAVLNGMRVSQTEMVAADVRYNVSYV